MTRLGIDSFWIEAPLSLVMAGAIAAVFGVIALRVKGIYFLLVTFALGELMVSSATSWKILSTDPKSTEGILGIITRTSATDRVGQHQILLLRVDSFYYLRGLIRLFCCVAI